MKYKEGGKKELSTSLYSALPETEEMKFAKAAMELQSEVGGRLNSDITPRGHFLWCTLGLWRDLPIG